MAAVEVEVEVGEMAAVESERWRWSESLEKAMLAKRSRRPREWVLSE